MRQAVENCREHAHVIAGSAIDCEPVLARAAENVAAADNQRDFYAEVVNGLYFARDALNRLGVNAELVRPRKRFARKLHHDAAVNRRLCGLLPRRVPSVGSSSRPNSFPLRGHSSRESAADDWLSIARGFSLRTKSSSLVYRRGTETHGFAAGAGASGSSDAEAPAQRHPFRPP